MTRKAKLLRMRLGPPPARPARPEPSGPAACWRPRGTAGLCDACGAEAAPLHFPLRLRGQYCAACCPACAPARPEAAMPRRDCLVTDRLAGRCSRCGAWTETMHLPREGGLYCDRCCPQCGSATRTARARAAAADIAPPRVRQGEDTALPETRGASAAVRFAGVHPPPEPPTATCAKRACPIPPWRDGLCRFHFHQQNYPAFFQSVADSSRRVGRKLSPRPREPRAAADDVKKAFEGV